MKKLYASENWVQIHYLHTVLENSGFVCILKNFYLRGAMGELPPYECSPELWIVNNEQYDDAKVFLKEVLTALRKKSSGKAWCCEFCGEKSAAQFTACWKCGKEHKT